MSILTHNMYPKDFNIVRILHWCKKLLNFLLALTGKKCFWTQFCIFFSVLPVELNYISFFMKYPVVMFVYGLHYTNITHY